MQQVELTLERQMSNTDYWTWLVWWRDGFFRIFTLAFS